MRRGPGIFALQLTGGLVRSSVGVAVGVTGEDDGLHARVVENTRVRHIHSRLEAACGFARVAGEKEEAVGAYVEQGLDDRLEVSCVPIPASCHVRNGPVAEL